MDTAADTSFEVVSEDENISIASAAEGIVSGGIYNIKNVNSGKYLNVHNGVDADGTNVYQWTKDGTAEQNFKIIYSPATDSYTFYAMCSSNGNGRVINIQIQRGIEPLASGQNVNLWDQDAAYTQHFTIIPLGQNQYRIACKNNTGLYLTVNDLNNGSSTGTAPTSPGNIYLCDYVASATQFWVFEQVGTASAAPPEGYAESVTASGVTGWVWRNDIPDTPVNVHVYVNNAQNQTVGFYTAVADIYRQDLYNAGFGSGYHAFSCPIDWKTYVPGAYTVIVYAIGYNGYNPAIDNMPVYTVSNCSGVVDVIDSTRISGWLWKPSAPDAAIDVHVHINRLNGENVGFYAATASNYREDLQSLGYGNGCHGYWINVDWSQYPEEQLQVVLYAVDGSGYNPSFWSGIYDNRRPINIIGMIDSDGLKFNTIYTTSTIASCENIGCTSVGLFSGANKSAVINRIKEASYCIVDTHGTPSKIRCFLDGVEQDALEIGHLNALADGYFNGTRCVLVAACYCGQGGASNPDNIVNTLHNKGVETVVGFEQKIYVLYDGNKNSSTYGEMNNERGSALWTRTFIQRLGEGDTVAEAIDIAYTKVLENLLIGVDDEGKPLPTDYGLGSIYVAGNANQVVKH